MDEQNLFNGYFEQDAPPEPNATAIPEAFAEPRQGDESRKQESGQTVSPAEATFYQDYTSMLNATPVSYTIPQGKPSKENYTSGLAITSLVLGIIGLVTLCCFPFVTVITGIVGIILYCIDRQHNSSGVGKAGFICSLIGLIISLLAIVFLVVVAVFTDTLVNSALMYY